ncbi:hypothetical protein E2542_SST28048 [Spatholobus suberectus]|nr:hypothetical protein E2542_SST28048 [Spatholobus suberectus]
MLRLPNRLLKVGKEADEKWKSMLMKLQGKKPYMDKVIELKAVYKRRLWKATKLVKMKLFSDCYGTNGLSSSNIFFYINVLIGLWGGSVGKLYLFHWCVTLGICQSFNMCSAIFVLLCDSFTGDGNPVRTVLAQQIIAYFPLFQEICVLAKRQNPKGVTVIFFRGLLL